jgi:hypothetical protein
MLDALDQLIVSERAAKKGDSPTRLLAAWLAEVWEGDRDEPMTFDGKIEANQLLSFLDDGALDVVGTGTQRSMLATAAEQTPPVGMPVVTKPERAASQTEVSAPESLPRPPDEPKRRRGLWLGLAAGAIVIAGGVGIAMNRGGDEKLERVEPPAPTPTPTPEPTPDPQPLPQPSHEENVVQPTPTPTPPTPTPTQKGKNPKTHVVKDAGSAAITTTPTVVKHKVILQTAPQWSWFTVDGGATKYQTLDPVELAPGTHTIHFTGNEYFPADKTITIEVGDQDLKKAVKLEVGTPP